MESRKSPTRWLVSFLATSVASLKAFALTSSVAEKLKREGREEMAHLSKAEEVEDADGNVYSRATYEALKKQGVL
jgi:splicing factor 3A subunit 3